MDVLLQCSLLSTEHYWSSIRLRIRFLVTSLTKAVLPQSLKLVGKPERFMVVPNSFQSWMIEATVITVTFSAAETFLYSSLDMYLDQSSLRANCGTL